MTYQILKAVNFVSKVHADQKYGDKPYTYHLFKVAELVSRNLNNPDVVCAALAHDVLEDTDTTISELTSTLGPEVASLVIALTTKKLENREPDLVRTYVHIAQKNETILIKLCDRVVNTEESFKNNPKKLYKYLKEYKLFKSYLFKPDLPRTHLDLFKHLDNIYSMYHGGKNV